MYQYEHHVKYYETDQMGVVHHSNYIRWFEEARVEFMREAQISYKTMETEGVMIPVVSVSCKYRSPARFDDHVVVESSVKKYNGVVIELSYVVRNKLTGEVCATGESSHCFVDSESFKPISLKMARPDMHQRFMQTVEV